MVPYMKSKRTKIPRSLAIQYRQKENRGFNNVSSINFHDRKLFLKHATLCMTGAAICPRMYHAIRIIHQINMDYHWFTTKQGSERYDILNCPNSETPSPYSACQDPIRAGCRPSLPLRKYASVLWHCGFRFREDSL